MPATARPIVLVSADERSLESYTWHAAIDTYLRAVYEAAQLTPVIVPSFGPDILSEELLAAAGGVLVTGSRSNVHPERYGHAPTPAHEPYDPARDTTTLPMIRTALERGIPLLAICRGHQELNVALGGTLATEIQEQEGRQDHRVVEGDHPHDVRFGLSHTVTLTPGGRLEAILGVGALKVNSLHRQAIAGLADGLDVEATAEDGTIEAVSVRAAQAFALGVQWHPEYWAAQPGEKDAASTRIFQAFGEAVRAYKA